MNILEVIRAVFGYILLFFIPGYALTWAFFPFRDELSSKDRVALSLVLSIASVTASVLFVDLYLGVDFTALNIVITILLVTGLAIALWRIRLFDAGKISEKMKNRMHMPLKRFSIMKKKGKNS